MTAPLRPPPPAPAPGPAPAPPARPRTGRSARPAAPAGRRGVLLAVLAAATALSAYALWNHAMWFDELQAWNIARASPSLGALAHHLRYEGHPIGWYLVLYALTRFTGDPRAMQVVELVVMTATTAVILFKAPWPLVLRVSLVASSFVFFEYGVISRAYGLGVLALVLVAVALGRPRPAWKAALLAAVVLAWTSLAGTVLAVAVALAVAYTRPAGPAPARRRFVLVSLLAAAGAALSCLPAPDFHAFTPSVGGLATVGAAPGSRLLGALSGLTRALIPIPARLGGWNTLLLDRLPAANGLEAAGSVLLFAVVLRALTGSPLARTLWCIGSVAVLAFFLVVVQPDLARYAGTVFLLFVVAAWLGAAPPGTAAPRTTALVPVLAAALAIQVVATFLIAPSLTAAPFAPARALASATRAHHLQGALVSGDDFDATAVGAYLDRSTYSVARRTWITFFVHDDRQARRSQHLTTGTVLCAAARLADQRHSPAGVITLTPPSRPPAGVRRLRTTQHVTLLSVSPGAAVPACAGAPTGAPEAPT